MSPQRTATTATALLSGSPTILTLAEFKEIIEIPGTSSTERDAAVRLALEAATEALQVGYGRTFVRQSAVHTYRPTRADYLDVLDLLSVSSITIDSLQDGTYVQPLPVSSVTLEPFDKVNYSRIRVVPISNYAFWPNYLTRVQGMWGLVDPYTGNAPPRVRQACVLLTDRFLRRNEAPFGILPGSDISGAVRIAREDPDVAYLMEQYDVVGGQSWYVA